MNLRQIKTNLEGRTGSYLGIKQQSAVLVPLIHVEQDLHMLLQVRSEHINSQPGEISFPGGNTEYGETPKETAIRETEEELGLTRDRFQVFGELDYLVTPFNLLIVPYVGYLDIGLSELRPNPDEVKEVFTIPLSFLQLTSPDVYSVKVAASPEKDFPYHLIPEGRDYKFRTGHYPSYFYKYQNYVIWGFTARILKHFIDLIAS